MRYQVFVDDNFHYHDEDERYLAGEYGTEDQALEAARGIVDRSLSELLQPGMTGDQLMAQYLQFGEDPFIVPATRTPFSARDYARLACTRLRG